MLVSSFKYALLTTRRYSIYWTVHMLVNTVQGLATSIQHLVLVGDLRFIMITSTLGKVPWFSLPLLFVIVGVVTVR